MSVDEESLTRLAGMLRKVVAATQGGGLHDTMVRTVCGRVAGELEDMAGQSRMRQQAPRPLVHPVAAGIRL